MNATDPTGAYECSTEDLCDWVEKRLSVASENLSRIKNSEARDAAAAAIAAYGKRGEKGVTIAVGRTQTRSAFAEVDQGRDGTITLTLNSARWGAGGDAAQALSRSGQTAESVLIHEGQHIVDYKGGLIDTTGQSRYDTERRAYGVEGHYLRGLGVGPSGLTDPYTLYTPSWERAANLGDLMRNGAANRAEATVCSPLRPGRCAGLNRW